MSKNTMYIDRMKMIRALTLLATLLVISSCTAIQSAGKPASPQHTDVPIRDLQSQIDSVLNDSLLSSAFIGLKIISLDDSAILYERNNAKLFHPASNMKLLTTAAALHLLDENFQFRTEVYSDSNVQNKILRGNLIIKGFGDPLFTSEDIDSVVAAIVKLNIHTIQRDIVGDISYFDSLYWGKGWMWDDEPDADEAFITPLTINSNAIKISVIPSVAVGKQPRYEIEPRTSFVKTTNTAVTSRDTSIAPLSVTRIRGENHIVIQGRIDPAVSKREFTLSVHKPELFFLTLLKERLESSGISVKGSLRFDTLDSQLTIATIRHELDSVIVRINKESDNIAAENLLKSMASEKYGQPGSAKNGLSLVRDYLFEAGIDTGAIILADGSGVSWYNALSPDAIVRLLQNEYDHSSAFCRFYESLPVSGTDGTLKNQMIGTSAEGVVHAKTGTLTGTSGLSGYVTTADGHLLAFSMLSNHFPGKVASLRDVQNKIMEILATYRFTK